MTERQEAEFRPEEQLIYTKDGAPFKSEKQAREAVKLSGHNPDNYLVVPVGDNEGFALKMKPPEDEYWWVTFHAASNPNDTPDVIICVEGETLVMQREKKIIVPQRFLHAADNARWPKFEQLPNKPRKIVAWIMTYPYTRYEKATKAEFLKKLRAGTDKVKKDIQKYGYNVEPDLMAAGE